MTIVFPDTATEPPKRAKDPAPPAQRRIQRPAPVDAVVDVRCSAVTHVARSSGHGPFAIGGVFDRPGCRGCRRRNRERDAKQRDGCCQEGAEQGNREATGTRRQHGGSRILRNGNRGPGGMVAARGKAPTVTRAEEMGSKRHTESKQLPQALHHNSWIRWKKRPDLPGREGWSTAVHITTFGTTRDCLVGQGGRHLSSRARRVEGH